MKNSLMKRMMNLMLVLSPVLIIGACSLQESESFDDSFDTIELIQTGDPAIDSSMMFLSVEELEAFGLVSVDSQDAVSTKSSVATPDYVSLYVYGPLHDRRLVRGKKVGVSFAKNWGWNPGESYTITYGFYGSVETTVSLEGSSYGNYVAFIEIPQDAEGFYFVVTGNNGITYNDEGDAFEMPVYDSIASVQLNGDKLTVNYSGDCIGFHEKLHYGWNDWQNVADTTMSSYSYTIPKYAQPGGYASTTITVPGDANYVDFVVNGNGIWDNNNGDNWHFSLNPLVDAQVISISQNGLKTISVYYVNGNLNPPIAHFGYDGWQDVKENKLTYTYNNQWRATVSVKDTADIFNVVFRNNYNHWENNFGYNWNISIQ